MEKSGDRVQWERRVGQHTWKKWWSCLMGAPRRTAHMEKVVVVSNGSVALDSTHGKSGNRVQWERRVRQRTWKKWWSCPMGASPWTAHMEKAVIVSNGSVALDSTHGKSGDRV